MNQMMDLAMGLEAKTLPIKHIPVRASCGLGLFVAFANLRGWGILNVSHD